MPGGQKEHVDSPSVLASEEQPISTFHIWGAVVGSYEGMTSVKFLRDTQ